MEENPFKTLGFNPRAFTSLHDHEIFLLVKAQYRTLMQIHHPDVSKRRNAHTQSAAIGLAFGKINLESNPSGFNYWKDAFMRSARTPKTSVIQNTQGYIREQHLQDLQDTIVDCLKGVYLSVPARPIRLPAPLATVNDGCAMVLEDTVKNAWISREKIRRKALEDLEYREGVPMPVFEMEITREGLMVHRAVSVNPLRKANAMPDPRAAWVKRNSLGVGFSLTVHPAPTKVVRGRIVGCISADRLRGFWDEGGAQTKRIIESGLTADEKRIVEFSGYTTDQVRPFLWLLKPELESGCIVVAMNQEGNKFLFLGKLLYIADASKAPQV